MHFFPITTCFKLENNFSTKSFHWKKDEVDGDIFDI